MKKYALLNNKAGMTLYEGLLLIVLISALFLLVPNVNKNICQKKIDSFLEIFTQDLNYSMSYSITNFTLVKFKLYPNDYYYYISDAKFTEIRKYYYDKKIKITSSIKLNTIDITHGITVNTDNFTIACSNIKYKVTIYEKSGILNVVKQ